MPKYRIDKSLVINATPEAVYEKVVDFSSWYVWSPWLISEPEAKVTVSSNPSSVGSKYQWEGTVVGSGEVIHRELKPGRLIADDLTFLKPFKSACNTTFEFQPKGSGTEVHWTMDGSMPWFMFFLIPILKTMIGMDFRRGLMMIKDWVETGVIPSKCTVHGTESIEAIRMAGLASSCSVEDVGKSMDKTFAEAEAEFAKHNIARSGPMISVYTAFKIKQGTFNYISGFCIPADAVIPPASKLVVWSLPACKAFRVEHVGSYRHLGNGWSIANQLVRFKKLRQCRTGTFEIYRTTPPKTAEADLKTDIYLPLK